MHAPIMQNRSSTSSAFFPTMLLRSWLLLPALTLLGIGSLRAATTLAVGDIQVLGVTSDSNDSFTFVLWKDIDSSTVIRFMDQSFTNATTGVIGSETDMSLSFTSALTAGTVIRVEDTGNTLVNGGSFSGTKNGTLSGISNDGDQVFIYQGTAMGSGTSFTGRTLLYGFNIADTNWVTSGADSNKSFLPTAINSLDANVDSGNFDNADYSGTRTGMTTAAYRAAIGNIANYTQSNTRTALATGGFTSSSSASLTWDNNGTTTGTGGTGTWDTITQSKFSNSTNSTFLHWVNSSAGNDHTAVFGGTAGTVSVASGGVTASGLTFGVSGYTIQNNTLTLSGSTPTISVTTSGHTATVSSALAGGTSLTKGGAGTLILSGGSNGTTTTTISAGTLQIGNAGTSGVLGSGAVTNNGTLNFNRTDSYGGTVSNNISGTGAVTLTQGALTLSGTNTYTGTTTVSGGVLKLSSAGALSGGIGTTGGTSNLTLSGGVVGLATGDFTRALGTGATQVQFTGSGGFAAYGADRSVNFGGAGATVTWGSGGFVPNGSSLILGAADSDKKITLENAINFGGTTRTIQVIKGTATGAGVYDAKLAGALSNGSYTQTGDGRLEVAGAITGTTYDQSAANGTLALTSTITVSGAYTQSGTGSTTTLSGSASINAGSFTQSGSGSATTVTGAGSIVSSSAASLTAGTVTLNSSAANTAFVAPTINIGGAAL
ncbi:MAG: hypothetical protein B7Z45_02050, partial [Azorhizobium sp. 12-66-6]